MKEICVLKAALAGFGPRSSDWIVLRQDDLEFVKVAMIRIDQVRDEVSPVPYGSGTRYDFHGPYEGMHVPAENSGSQCWHCEDWEELWSGYVVRGDGVPEEKYDFYSLLGETPEEAVQNAWERGLILLPEDFKPVLDRWETDVLAFLHMSMKAYEAAQRLASAKAE